MNRRTRKLQFSAKARKEIYERDGRRCLFCALHYRIQPGYGQSYELHIFETMHIVPRSRGGLGIARNGLIGCKYHHRMLDGGPKEIRQEMQGIIEGYMKSKYKDWKRENLVYRKE